jgi:hypothetical protein
VECWWDYKALIFYSGTLDWDFIAFLIHILPCPLNKPVCYEELSYHVTSVPQHILMRQFEVIASDIIILSDQRHGVYGVFLRN